MKTHFKALCTFSLLVATTLINEGAVAGDSPFGRRLSVTATAISDEVLETVATEDIAILSDAAIRTFGQIVVPVNEHFTELEILEAATIKSDGRRLNVPADKILLSTLPNSPQLGIFEADLRISTIVFPDVAVGDTLHYKVRKRDQRRGLSGGFSAVYTVPASGRFDDVRITLDAPKTLAVAESSRGFVRSVEERDQRRTISWSLEPQAYQADETGATALIDRAPHVVFSSYADWQVVGKSFLDGAAPMSTPTSELRALADEITHGIPERHDQAVAIFNWVSKNIRYFAIFLGQGGFVPHSAQSVLTDKYGDCKDHVTLMRALLAAKGIDADYALISLSPIYREFQVPTPDWFNHVILWLPEFDQYVDPTASTASFFSLPDTEADKAVLRIGPHGISLARTPPLAAEKNRLTITADVTLSPSGTAKGRTTISAAGAPGVHLRGAMAQAALKGSDVFTKELLAKQNWRGTGNIAAKDEPNRSEPFIVESSYDLSNKFFSENGNGNSVPVGPRLVSPAWTQFDQVLKNKHLQDFVCKSEIYEQVIDLHLPDGQLLTNVPGDVELRNRLASFEARYAQNEQTLHLTRTITLHVPGQSCSVQTAKDIAPIIEAAAKEFGWHPQFIRKEAN